MNNQLPATLVVAVITLAIGGGAGLVGGIVWEGAKAEQKYKDTIKGMNIMRADVGGGGGDKGGAEKDKKDAPKVDNKVRFAGLVTRVGLLLDTQIQFNDEEKAQLRKVLDGLDKLDSLSEEQAAERMKVLVLALSRNANELNVRGIRVPSDDSPTIDLRKEHTKLANPFTYELSAQALKSLQKSAGQ